MKTPGFFWVLLVSFSLLINACRVDYTPYHKSEYKTKKLGPKAYKEDFRTCEKHTKRLHKAVVRVAYGIVCVKETPPETIPHAVNNTICGGAVEGKKLAVVLRCSACQKEFKESLKKKE